MMRFDLSWTCSKPSPSEGFAGSLARTDAGGLGLVPPDDRDGCLQDVHWYGGAIGGGFQGYTIGNILSAQFFDAALKADPEISHEIAAGEYRRLHQWLRTHVYQYGRKFKPNELVERATGGEMSIGPYLSYLRN
jgi:carboxypeptidase Taq